MEGKSLVAGSILLGAAMVASAWMLAPAFEKAADKMLENSRVVVVKGLAERTVDADRVVMPFTFSECAPTLEEAVSRSDKAKTEILKFLNTHGVKREDIHSRTPSLSDTYKETYNTNRNPECRFNIRDGINIDSRDVVTVKGLYKDLDQLVKAGVPLDDSTWSTNFIFTGLNNIKPSMIEESTRNARQVAEKFAHDSGSALGRIKTATQGQFSITDEEGDNSRKVVRVVSTVTYFLND